MDATLNRDDDLLGCFLDESLESLQPLAEDLAAYGENPAERELINQVFRAVHSIKGNSGCFGITRVHQFSHSVEHTLDALRNGDIHLNEDLNRTLIESFDFLEGMLQSVGEGVLDAEMPPAGKRLLKRLGDVAAECRAERSDPASDGEDGGVVEATACGGEASAAADSPAGAFPASPADKPQTRRRGADNTVRIKQGRLDEFVEGVARVFVTSEQFKELQPRLDLLLGEDGLAKELRGLSTTLTSQVGSLEQSVAALRKVPIRPLLAKNARLARDLAVRLNKKVRVRVAGEETEVDKTLLEDLDAPLMHIARNAIDHGIGTPEERLARQVEEAGNLWLKAELTATHVVITVQDDGRGIDPERIREKALEKGVASPSELRAMSDQEAVQLIFHPGFSTAGQVTDVSGRGVGLDVVRTNVRKHDGDVKVESRVGVGTVFRIEVPIRRMVLVIDALLVQQAAAVFAVPFKHIDRILECDPAHLRHVQGAAVIISNARTFPAVRLGSLLQLEESKRTEVDKVSGVLVRSGEDVICLLVDRVLGRKKIVVNDIGGLVEGGEKIAGVAQLGGERLALVLSVPELLATGAGRPIAAPIHRDPAHAPARVTGARTSVQRLARHPL